MDGIKASDSGAQSSQYESRPSLESAQSVANGKEKDSADKPKIGMRAAISKVAHRLSISSRSSKDRETLAGSEEEFEAKKKQEAEAQKRQREYEKFGLGKKGLGKGGMQMGA